MADSDKTEIIVASAALFVSLIALLATLLQCLQQYFASARGFSQCNEKVMGGWHKSKTRKFRLEDLRFETEVEIPVIFVCPPANDKGALDGKIQLLDGTPQSLAYTWTEDYQKKDRKQRMRTSDNERASWTILLSAIQSMEIESQMWHRSQFDYFSSSQPPQTAFRQHGLPSEPPSLAESHTLVVAVQKKRMSWDTMPASITRPYATTTMCHLLEIIAAMGIYWKKFDRTNDRYRAEGNGFMVLGERVAELGLAFTFQVNGLSRFEKNRVIPVDEVKELCFGWVPTIFRSTQDKRRLEVPVDLLDLSTLLVATRSEIAETLQLIGCNHTSVATFMAPGRRVSHLFPISFEIVGMLSQNFHIENTFFTHLPNPTPDRWDARSIDLGKALRTFKGLCLQEPNDAGRTQVVVERLSDHISAILRHQGDDSIATLLRFRALHVALDDADELLTGRSKQSRRSETQDISLLRSSTQRTGSSSLLGLRRRFNAFVASPGPSPDSIPLRTTQEDEPPGLSLETPRQQRRRKTVQTVLRFHLQEVIRQLNLGDDRSRSMSPVPCASTTMDDVDVAGPDERQEKLMQLYYDQVRRVVVRKAAKADAEDAGLEADQNVTHDDIWCTLVFRMICWLMLHDFNKLDVQVPKTETHDNAVT
ncbi:uncharacterized protein J7T54_005654 [Emericellopsis cladophorae]|uniref:Modin n=1 Tax=Emericellopsis cladophorae TaxID=2686198 RepID=A0A9P9Y5B6_9HYPO|nr:uncharacterized protein J7T54_005654 [Emericellopsis cladophorae]KAI6783625.1 hypothetical protein J7T54_005654 [Emericellopsis cladophorae]